MAAAAFRWSWDGRHTPSVDDSNGRIGGVGIGKGDGGGGDGEGSGEDERSGGECGDEGGGGGVGSDGGGGACGKGGRDARGREGDGGGGEGEGSRHEVRSGGECEGDGEEEGGTRESGDNTARGLGEDDKISTEEPPAESQSPRSSLDEQTYAQTHFSGREALSGRLASKTRNEWDGRRSRSRRRRRRGHG